MESKVSKVSRLTVFCVQSYRAAEGRLQRDGYLQFTSATEAETAGERLSARADGVAITVMDGYPEADAWNEPELFASVGRIPRE